MPLSGEAAAAPDASAAAEDPWLGFFVHFGPELAALAAVAGLLGAVCLALRARGARTVAGSCLFVATLVSTQLLMRALAQPPYGYKFPGLVAVLHFTSVAVVCAAYWVVVGEPEKLLPGLHTHHISD